MEKLEYLGVIYEKLEFNENARAASKKAYRIMGSFGRLMLYKRSGRSVLL